MPAYKDKDTGTWYVAFYYRDWNNQNKKKLKRGFATKKEALDYETNFLVLKNKSIDVTLNEFYEIYKKDRKPRLKLNTWLTKSQIIETHILPYFGQVPIDEIESKDIIDWQNELSSITDDYGTNYSPTYLRTINSQFSAMFNHAVRFYGLPENPIHKAGSMGKKHADEMSIWTKDEFEKFLETQTSDSMAETGFLILFWGGLRIGELLALTKKDFNFEECYISINKSFQRINRKDVITEPKTEKSKRLVYLAKPVMDKVELYVESRYGYPENARVFDKTKSFFSHRMVNGSKKAGVKRIRIHDLRHSHVSLLIEMGFSPVDIANRMGHENINITMRYAHMMPSKQVNMADKMTKLLEEE